MRSLPLLLACGVAACSEFDPALYQRAELAARTADRCVEGAVPLVGSSAQTFELDLAMLDDSWQVANCADGRALGNDGFFAVDMVEGQKFHFHVTAIDAIDPVVYVVDSCDERVCQPLTAASSCGTEKEHLSFLAPRTSRYFVGVDSAEPGGGRVEVLALAPVCGDGEKQHSEACDDANRNAGDGCDALCRLELPASDRLALEPNDDFTVGNHLAITPGEPFVVHGTLEGPCDPEIFSFDAPVSGELRVRMLAPGGAPCAALDPETRLDLQLYEALTVVATGALTTGSACPELAFAALRVAEPASMASPAAASTYHVRMLARGPTSAPPVDYTLEVTLTPTSDQN